MLAAKQHSPASKSGNNSNNNKSLPKSVAQRVMEVGQTGHVECVNGNNNNNIDYTIENATNSIQLASKKRDTKHQLTGVRSSSNNNNSNSIIESNHEVEDIKNRVANLEVTTVKMQSSVLNTNSKSSPPNPLSSTSFVVVAASNNNNNNSNNNTRTKQHQRANIRETTTTTNDQNNNNCSSRSSPSESQAPTTPLMADDSKPNILAPKSSSQIIITTPATVETTETVTPPTTTTTTSTTILQQQQQQQQQPSPIAQHNSMAIASQSTSATSSSSSLSLLPQPLALNSTTTIQTTKSTSTTTTSTLTNPSRHFNSTQPTTTTTTAAVTTTSSSQASRSPSKGAGLIGSESVFHQIVSDKPSDGKQAVKMSKESGVVASKASSKSSNNENSSNNTHSVPNSGLSGGGNQVATITSGGKSNNNSTSGNNNNNNNKQQQQQLIGGEKDRISLDTKVPHPSKNDFNNSKVQQQQQQTSGQSSKRDPSTFEEEVGYYNDTTASTANLLPPKLSTSSSLSSTSPPSSFSEINSSGALNKIIKHSTAEVVNSSSNTTNTTTTNAKVTTNLKEQQHKLSITVPGTTTSSSCISSRQQLNKQQHRGQMQHNKATHSREYLHHERELLEEDDDHYARYDNAMVENDTNSQNQFHFQKHHHQYQPCNSKSNNKQRCEFDFKLPSGKFNTNALDSLPGSHDDSATLAPTSGLLEATSTTTALSTPTLSTSPKAKSAPATPCNVTPTAMDQHSSPYYLNSLMLNPNPANTLPSDIRRNISATCRKLPSSIGLTETTTLTSNNDAGSGSTTILNGSANGISRVNSRTYLSKHHMDELIKRADSMLNSKDYKGAVYLYTQWIELAKSQNILCSEDEVNFKVFSQRADAYFNLGDYEASAEDSMAARTLNPKWTHAYYKQGKAQFLLRRYLDSLAAFAFGFAQDSSNSLLFEAFVEAALKCNLFKDDFEPKYNKLKSLNMDKDPFVVISVLGQDILARGNYDHAAVILESALNIGSDKRRLLGSVLSTISFAHFMGSNYDKAIDNMQTELEIEEEVLDVTGQCRVLGNIGFTYYKMRKYDKSLEAHRMQVNRAMRAKLFEQASLALNAIGHIHVARGDFSSALTSHSRCLEILKQLGDNNYSQYKEILSIGYIHSMLGDYEATEKKYGEAIELLELSNRTNKIKPDDYLVGLAMVHFNLAYLALKKQLFCEANARYTQVIELSKRFQDKKLGFLIEMRASNGLGQTHRLFKEFDRAKTYFERQLELARSLEDLAGQSQALCNLGMVYQHFKDYNLASEKFDENLRLVKGKDSLLEAYAHSYMASMYFLINKYNNAQAHYETSLELFKKLDYCLAEKKTIDLNMAAVHERMGHSDLSLSRMARQKHLMLA